jgi:hypothetical protein
MRTEGLGAEQGAHFQKLGEKGQHVREAVAHCRGHLTPTQTELACWSAVKADGDADICTLTASDHLNSADSLSCRREASKRFSFNRKGRRVYCRGPREAVDWEAR